MPYKMPFLHHRHHRDMESPKSPLPTSQLPTTWPIIPSADDETEVLSLPPPNRYKKNSVNVPVDCKLQKSILAYKQKHRREAAEIELSCGPSHSPRQIMDEWWQIFRTNSSSGKRSHNTDFEKIQNVLR